MSDFPVARDRLLCWKTADGSPMFLVKFQAKIKSGGVACVVIFKAAHAGPSNAGNGIETAPMHTGPSRQKAWLEEGAWQSIRKQTNRR